MKKRKPWLLFYCLTIIAVLLAAYWGGEAITVISENNPIERKTCVIVDPGHGGEDGGATSCTGKLESELNLEIATRLNDMFNLLGYDTKMTRTSDISIYTKGETLAQKKISDLKERIRIVNETENGLLLSIHQNTFSDGRYHGAQVFYSENPSSQQLAKHLQLALCTALNPTSNRKSKKSSSIYLLEHIEKTGVLIECGFLSNSDEEAKLRSTEYQKNLCCVISAAVVEFLSNT